MLTFTEMPRDTIFDNLVTDENSMTELLCNLTRLSPFRRALLARLFSDGCSSRIAENDIRTQKRLDGWGQPDLIIRNDEIYALVEVKVSNHCGLTPNQPNSYFESLLKDKTPQRWLVFLVPKDWLYLGSLKESLRLLSAAHRESGIQARILHWEDVLDVTVDVSRREPTLSPVLGEFGRLVSSWFVPTPIPFSKQEVQMLFSKDFAVALSNLFKLIGQIRDKGRVYKSSYRCLGDLYFKSNHGENILWFGLWPNFYRQEGIPLCFGVDDHWPTWVQEAFRGAYKGETKRFEGWTLGWVSQEDLEGNGAIEKVWQELDPLLQAIVQADVAP